MKVFLYADHLNNRPFNVLLADLKLYRPLDTLFDDLELYRLDLSF